MQTIDSDDPRRPNVKIAASLRAAILSGELEPGSRLESVKDLAAFYGVATATVHSAIRTLREEGFVRSQTGSGNYVAHQAAVPVPDDETHPLPASCRSCLKWAISSTCLAGMVAARRPATGERGGALVPIGIVGMALAMLEVADPGRVSALCVLHDAHETRIGDVPATGRAYITTAKPEAITAHQTAGMPAEMAKMFQELTAEFEAAETIEARVARDADKLETLLQAIEYGEQGFKTEAWIQTSIEALRTESAKQLARAINSADPAGWWSTFAASYHELRATSRGRSR